MKKKVFREKYYGKPIVEEVKEVKGVPEVAKKTAKTSKKIAKGDK